MRIGIDLDGVSCQFLAGCAEVCGVNDFDISKITTWDALYDYVPPGRDLWEWLSVNSPNVFHNLAPIDGAIEGIKQLKEMDHTLVFITARPDWAKGSARYWLEANGIPYDEIHEIWDKTQVKCDIYIDDAPHNLEALRSVGHTIRMVAPYNHPLPDVADAYNWQDIVQIVKEINYGRCGCTGKDVTYYPRFSR